MQCKKCGEMFKIHVIINGKHRNLNNRKYCLNCSPFGVHNTKRLVPLLVTDIKNNNRRSRKCVDCSSLTYGLRCRSCAMVFKWANHASYLKIKKKIFKCKLCSKPISSSRRICAACYGTDWNNKTLAEFKQKARYQIHSIVRAHARAVFKETGIPAECSVCGYSKHVELHHVKSIKMFKNTAKGLEINNLENLAVLCPNHHWEADKGLIFPVRLSDQVRALAAAGSTPAGDAILRKIDRAC